MNKLARRGASVAVLDDGFQHTQLARDLDIVLLPAHPPGNRQLLPCGPFREPLGALARANWIVLTGPQRAEDECATAAPAPPCDWWTRGAVPARTARVTFEEGGWVDLMGDPADQPEGEVVAVSAVARPDRFTRQLALLGHEPSASLVFADHHRFTARDAETIGALSSRHGGATVVATEKDAVKLRAFRPALGRVRVLRQVPRWRMGEDALEAALLEVAGLRAGGDPT